MSPERAQPPLALFEAYGIELEYMIVDRETLAVRPIADTLLSAFTGGEPTDYEEGVVAWSNELVLHVIELKTNGPTPALAGWAGCFGADVRRIDQELARHGAMLLPTAMHPTMDPARETRLWPHECGEIYATYDRIFGCRRHGWANLQSCHVNLPFQGDDEFRRLHAAIRVVLPLVPALAASSPMMDGGLTGTLDNRLHVYCTHQSRIPAAMGLVVPETVRTRREYGERIFSRIDQAVRALDPDGILQHEFLNARGAIARFQRDAIEIRLLDVQETPAADLAIALLVTAVVRALAEERWAPLDALDAFTTEELAAVLHGVIRDGERTPIEDDRLLVAFGRSAPMTAGELWRALTEDVRRDDADWRELEPALRTIFERGPLARRILAALGDAPDQDRVAAVYRELGRCLVEGRQLH